MDSLNHSQNNDHHSVILCAYGKLRTGQALHFLMLGLKPKSVWPRHEHYFNEVYRVNIWHIRFLDVVEFLCGYRRIQVQGQFIYIKLKRAK